MDKNKVGSGLHMESFSSKNIVEDFLKMEYQEGLRNEFAMKEALINKLSKDTITGKKKYKSFALGITDNVRALGRTADRYELGFNDYMNKGVETVEAEFDTTKLMATFSVTDEVLLKGTSDGSLIDVVKDSLDRMQLALSHTMSRFTYGAPDGKIGTIGAKEIAADTLIQPFSLASVTGSSAKPTWDYPYNKFYSAENGGPIDGIPNVIEFYMSNSYSVLPGMGLAIDIKPTTPSSGTATWKRYVGRIWQKVNVSLHDEKIIMFVDKYYERTETYGADGNTFGAWAAGTINASALTVATDDIKTNGVAKVYSRQLDDTAVDPQPEYHGLEAIVINKDGEYDKIFGVDRGIYQSLKSTTHDLNNNAYINEELLRDMSDHLELTSPDGTGITVVAANHRIISAVEKSLYQFKEYSMDTAANGTKLGGRATVTFDNYQLMKDSFARDNNVYMLDQNKIGELVRRDFQWITSGDAEGVLSRRPGTELYEGIMNKYADMYIDAWRAHAAILNCKVPSVGTYLSYNTDGSPK